MKFLIASDIHGSATWCHKLMDAIEAETPDRVVLLGDLLYHGPRNDLPDGYAPKEVAAMLNSIAEEIIAVRGNCEAEVDQMMLDFPCLADYVVVLDAGSGTAEDADTSGSSTGGNADAPRGNMCELFCTHGHVYGPGLHNSVNNMPKLTDKSIVLYGHTHIKVDELVPASGAKGASDNKTADERRIHVFNPGSVSIPKDDSHSYGIYEDGKLRHVILS